MQTRPEYYVMQDGTVWVVTSEGTIGVLLVNADEFNIKYHARTYFSWRLGAEYEFMPHPVRIPEVKRSVSYRGAVRFPYFHDIIGFQTDVDKCVIFNTEGDMLYEGDYDGRRFPLLFNGENNSIQEHSEFKYGTVPIHFPLINKKTTDRWGAAGQIRFTAESGQTVPVPDKLSAGFAAVAWKTDRKSTRTDGKRCGYEPVNSYARYSVSRSWGCKKKEELPGGDIGTGLRPILPRDKVQEKICRPANDDGTQMQEVFLCEQEEVVHYHKCTAEFLPDTPLKEQIQGFDLHMCGNFVRVVFRNAKIASNKWYRYIGNIESEDLLPEFFPKDFVFEETERSHTLIELLKTLPKNPKFDEQDDWGMPLWWKFFLPTFYVYGAHPASMYQWMRFADQERDTIPNLNREGKEVHVPGGQADKARLKRIEEAGEHAGKQDLAGFCDPAAGAEKILTRTLEGTKPSLDAGSEAWDAWDPFDPNTYGIRQFDVISVGSSSETTPDSHRRWFYFTGYDWVEGEGFYQDLKNYSNEDLSVIFYKGQQGTLNTCAKEVHTIPANEDRIKCCGDFLLVGLNTDFESRMIFFRDRKILDIGLESPPSSEQHGKESFICCNSFFAYGLLELTSRVQAAFYDVELDDEGAVKKQNKIWSGSFDIHEAPDFGGGCADTCRYYFARQTDKKGLYFYRDAVDRGGRGMEYGSWRFLKALDIKNDTNTAPPGGCVSTGGWCSLPCEGANDVQGIQRYLNGAKISEQCEMMKPSYQECVTTAQNISCTGTENPCKGIEAKVVLKETRCDHYTNVGDGGICYPDNTFRMTSQSFSSEGLGAGVGPDGTVIQNEPSDPKACRITVRGVGQTYPSGSTQGAFETFGSNSYNSVTIRRENGTSETYNLEQCSGTNTLRLRRQSDQAILDSIDMAAAAPDWEGLPEVPAPAWSIHRTCPSESMSCTICHGESDPGFSLPGRTASFYPGGWNCPTTYTRGVEGRPEDSFCAYGNIHQQTAYGIQPAVNCVTSWNYKVWRRMTGNIYIIDPYNETILTYNTGMGGTTCSQSDGQWLEECCSTAKGGSVCLNDIHYQVFMADEWDNGRAVLMEGPVYDDVEKTVTVNFVGYEGKVNGCIYHPVAAGSVGIDPEALWCCYIGQGIGIGPGTQFCGWMDNSKNCNPDISCSNAKGRTYSGSEGEEGVVIVDVTWKDRIFRYRIGGYVSHAVTPPELRCCGPYTILYLGNTGHLHYRRESLESGIGKDWHFSGCCGEAVILKQEVTGEQRVFIEGQEMDIDNILQGDPYAAADSSAEESLLLSKDYPLSVQCCSGGKEDEDAYYLFYCHEENQIEWAKEYIPDERTYLIESFGADDNGMIFEPDPDQKYDFSSPQEAMDHWKATNQARMALLDGTKCYASAAHVQLVSQGKYGQGDTIRVGPAKWKTKGIARPAVIVNNKEIYPAVHEYEFNDPLAPWWDGGKTGRNPNTLHGDSTEGVMSLLQTLTGIHAGEDFGKRTERNAMTWPFGFRVIPGKNVAAAYYKTTFLYNDSRMTDVQCYADGAFGVFTFTGAGYYWRDIPLIERSHERSEILGPGALEGTYISQVWKSHFDLYMGLPNPLPQKSLAHELPGMGEDWTQLGEWLQRYVPYGAYIFNRRERLSDSFDADCQDEIEPPMESSFPELEKLFCPPYHRGFYDPDHDHTCGHFLWFNDRHAPVRFDRALGWAKPFEDHCEHRDYEYGESMDYIRSPFTDGTNNTAWGGQRNRPAVLRYSDDAPGGNRVVVGANGVLHVFDNALGRMDFNAETLIKIEEAE
jgi:hypothetical protein